MAYIFIFPLSVISDSLFDFHRPPCPKKAFDGGRFFGRLKLRQDTELLGLRGVVKQHIAFHRWRL